MLGGYISDKVEDGDGLREEVAYYLQVRDVLVHLRYPEVVGGGVVWSTYSLNHLS